jgi:hypothetical protein
MFCVKPDNMKDFINKKTVNSTMSIGRERKLIGDIDQQGFIWNAKA